MVVVTGISFVSEVLVVNSKSVVHFLLVGDHLWFYLRKENWNLENLELESGPAQPNLFLFVFFVFLGGGLFEIVKILTIHLILFHT